MIANTIEVWAPRFKDRKALIAPWKVQSGVNRIVFTKTKMPNFLINGETIKSCPMESNGTAGMYAVPLNICAVEKGNQECLKL